ncbi:MAG: hypothetical protein Q9168_005795 [Polycauliona sp. 1 TL-2023]
MSGIEAAGLVLGAIPIVIGALESYKTTRKMWHQFLNKSLFVDRLINALQEQRLLIELDLQFLLRAAGCEDDTIARLDTSGCYELLLDEELAEPVRQYLGRVYEKYQVALARCERIVDDIAQCIGGLRTRDPSPQTHKNYLADLIDIYSSSTGLSQWSQTSQKIKFALKKDELVQKISELNDSTKMLERLRVAGGMLQDDDRPASSSPRLKKLSSFLNKIQKFSGRLYFAIADACNPGCHPLHSFKLYLEDRSAPLLKKNPRVFFRIEPLSTDDKAWYCTHVEAFEEEQARPTTTNVARSSSRKVPAVTFDLVELDIVEKTEVQDLCAVITEASNTKRLLRLFLSEEGKLACCHTPIDTNLHRNSSLRPTSTLTLQSILQTAYESRSTRWSVNQRMLLAYQLASSLLQFHSTPWLGGTWRKQFICFSQSSTNSVPSSPGLYFDAASPFIIHDFNGSPVASFEGQTNVKASLLDLGILLLEIWHVTPFEVYAAKEGLPLDNTYGVRYDAASRWLNDTADNILHLYRHPVCRCIEGTLASSASTFEWTDPQFQTSVCECIVKPLWDISSSQRS